MTMVTEAPKARGRLGLGRRPFARGRRCWRQRPRPRPSASSAGISTYPGEMVLVHEGPERRHGGARRGSRKKSGPNTLRATTAYRTTVPAPTIVQVTASSSASGRAPAPREGRGESALRRAHRPTSPQGDGDGPRGRSQQRQAAGSTGCQTSADPGARKACRPAGGGTSWMNPSATRIATGHRGTRGRKRLPCRA